MYLVLGWPKIFDFDGLSKGGARTSSVSRASSRPRICVFHLYADPREAPQDSLAGVGASVRVGPKVEAIDNDIRDVFDTISLT